MEAFEVRPQRIQAAAHEHESRTFSAHRTPYSITGHTDARATMYQLFARLFHEAPSESLLRAIVSEHALTLAAGSTQALEELQWVEQAEEIAVEFASLFVVPGDRRVAPYESVYCDSLRIDTSTACSAYFESDPQGGTFSGFLHGPSSVAVRQAYQQAGFELDPSAHELPDHLAVELEFIAWLLERGALEQVQSFFREHLGRWVFRCLDEIRLKAPGAFYRAVVDALAAFLRSEQQAQA